jgi:hypothetical protein
VLHYETLPPGTLDLLKALCAHRTLAPFALAGGTSLALRFGHRTSVDLDFFTSEPFDNDVLVDELKQDFPLDDRRRGPTGVAAILHGVRLDFVKYRYKPLHAPDVIDEIRLMSLPDVVAMKLSAITNRGEQKNFFDLHTLLTELGLPFLLQCYNEKFPGTDPMMLHRSLTYFDDADEGETPKSLIGMTWPKVKQSIQRAVKAALQ